MINGKRKEIGLEPITREAAGHIWSAEKMGIGNAAPERIEMRDSKVRG